MVSKYGKERERGRQLARVKVEGANTVEDHYDSKYELEPSEVCEILFSVKNILGIDYPNS